MIKFILASKSTARKQLMHELGIEFTCITSDYPEDMSAQKEPHELVIFLASGKTNHIAHKHFDSIIIGADTIVLVDWQILGIPRDQADAKEMIQLQSGNKIQVISGLSVIKTGPGGEKARELISSCSTEIIMGVMPQRIIDKIAGSSEILHCAGALKIENDIGAYIQEIRGDYNNILGLPLFQLREMLEELDIKLP